MSQATTAIADGTGAQVLAELTSAFSAAQSWQFGSTDPYTAGYNVNAGTWWMDQGNMLVKQRNLTNDAWVTKGKINTDGTVCWYDDLGRIMSQTYVTIPQFYGINEFLDNQLTITYVSPTSFTVAGNLTAIFTANRKVKIYLSSSTAISYVASSAYGTVTTVTLGSAVLDATVTAVKYSIIQDGMPQDYSLALAESTGYGIVSGCVPSINGLTVTVASGVVHLPDGTRKKLSASAVTLNVADSTNPRIDLVYITSAGTVTKITGTAATSPVVPSVPTGGISVCNVNVAAGVTTGTVTDSRDFALITNKNVMTVKEGHFENLVADDVIAGTVTANDIISKGPVVDVRAFGAVGDGVTDDSIALSNAFAFSKNIYFPPGNYLISQSINCNNQAINIRGAGKDVTFIKINTSSATLPILAKVKDNSHISNISFNGTAVTNNGTTTYYGSAVSGAYHRYTFNDVDFYHLRVGIIASGRDWYGVNKFNNCRFSELEIAIQGSSNINNYTTFINCEFFSVRVCFEIMRMNVFSLTNCDLENIDNVFSEAYTADTLYSAVSFTDCFMEGVKIIENATSSAPPVQGQISISGGYISEGTTPLIHAISGTTDYNLFLSVHNVYIKSSIPIFLLNSKVSGIFRGDVYDVNNNKVSAGSIFSGSHNVKINP